MNNHKEFYLLKGRMACVMFTLLQGMLMLLQLGETTVVVATNPDTLSSARFLAWMNGTVLSSDTPYGIHYLGNSTTHKIQSSAWVPAIVFRISFLNLVVCMTVLNAQ